WPKRSLAKSAVWYQHVLADDPQNLRAMAWLAETLWREGNVPAALSQLERVREGHIEGDIPEEERVKAIALRVARDMEARGAR
ncbi:MAG TPA: tetratricopeptide repeat protein, partial [Myxococcaceae bacterium]|nr:tetratricopeptide repeat protein [Myxococcaceae bacterium]